MKITLSPHCLLLLLVLCTQASAQNWKYTFGWSLTYTYGQIDKQAEVSPTDYGTVRATPGLSVSWPQNKNTTGLPAFENFLRLGVYSAGIEHRINNRWSILSGVEIGGRSMNITEYAKKSQGPVEEENMANRARRSFIVCSVPLLAKYKVYANKIDYSLVGGIYLNQSFSSARTTPFYSTPQGSLFFPALSLGFRVSPAKNKGLAFECAYQQGLSNAMEDRVTVRSGALAGQPPKDLVASSLGSHFRVGLSYGIPFRQPKTKPSASSAFVPYKERRVGRRIKIKSLSENFRICFKDNETVDTDSIRIVFNNTSETFIELSDTVQCLSFDVQYRLVNTIDVYAVNEGRMKPNTMEIRYTDHRNRRKVLVLHNPMDRYARIKVVYLK